MDKHSCIHATVCKGAKADLVFLIDGSWSIGDESFNKVIQFVTSMIGAFEVISPSGMQVRALSAGLMKDVLLNYAHSIFVIFSP